MFKLFRLFGRQVFLVCLTVFGEWIGDLCKSCFVGGDFALLRVVRVGVVDPMSVFAQNTSFDFSLFLTSCYRVCAC